MKRFLFLLLCFILPQNIFSQNVLEKQFEFAVNLFKNENYFDAITEFKRLLFFDKDSLYQYNANFMIGKSYKEGAKFSDAIFYFSKAELNSKNNEEIYKAKIEIIRSNILRRTTERALKLLDELEFDKRFNNKNDEINYWRGWSYIFADDWQSAANYFGKISENHPLKKLCARVHNDKYSVQKAKIFSYIIPGAGQFYTGNYLSGILSLAWNALWGYVSINSLIEDRILDGLLTADLLWLRFYKGNIQNAEKFAVEKNIEISNEALNYLQFNYKGTKP